MSSFSIWLTSIKVIVGTLLLTSCRNKSNDLILIRYDMPTSAEVDTIENYPEKDLYLLGQVTNHAFGKFEYDYIIVKKNRFSQIAYKIENGKLSVRVSKDLIAFVEPSALTNWGWFNIKNNKLVNELPGIKRILDSLKSASPKDFFIRETNGFFTSYKAGKPVSFYNYGEVVIDNSKINLENLKYGLYKLQAHSLVQISDNGDDLFKQSDGIYFVSPPGYGVITKFTKESIYKAIDSAVSSTVAPEEIRISSNHP